MSQNQRRPRRLKVLSPKSLAPAKDSREEAADRKSLQTESLTAGDEAKKQSPAGEPDADKLTTRARSLLDSVTNGAIRRRATADCARRGATRRTECPGSRRPAPSVERSSTPISSRTRHRATH